MPRFVLCAVCVVCGLPLSGLGYDGESMAPGLARLRILNDDGKMTVLVLETTFSGTWRKAASERDTRLLREHWHGTRKGLESQRDKFAVSELVSVDGVPLHCEFIRDSKHPVGVCEESGSRLYYLTGPDE